MTTAVLALAPRTTPRIACICCHAAYDVKTSTVSIIVIGIFVKRNNVNVA
jgi:hypothetical protein